MSDPVAAWQRRHAGVHANLLVRQWLRALDPIARGLGGVPPDVLTALGVAACGGAVAARSRWAAAGLLVGGGLCDALDGMMAGEPSPRGRRLDHAADRVADVALVACLRRRGAPRAPCVAAMVAVLAQEGARGGSTVVTVGERPTRVLLGTLGCLGVPPRLVARGLAAVSGLSFLVLVRDRRRSSR